MINFQTEKKHVSSDNDFLSKLDFPTIVNIGMK